MPLISRREFCGVLTAATLVGCSEPEQAPPPLPMGPPVDKPKGGTTVAPDLSGVPESFDVKFETTKGDFVIHVHRDWAPNAAARFLELVKAGFYDECRFFRVVPNFVVQWGIHADPKVMDKWRDNNIPDDPESGPHRQQNQKGYVTFARSGAPNSRSTQLFINFKDNFFLDTQQRGFTPFGHVSEGLEIAESINAEYGESPDQGRIQSEGNTYLNKEFPNLDYIKKATLIEPSATKDEAKPANDSEKTPDSQKSEEPK